jgi:hypothetical protein
MAEVRGRCAAGSDLTLGSAARLRFFSDSICACVRQHQHMSTSEGRKGPYSETTDLFVFVGVVHSAFTLDLDVWRRKTRSRRWSRRGSGSRRGRDTLRLK